MSEKRTGGQENFVKGAEEKKERVTMKEILDLENSPWQDLTEDLPVLANPEILDDPKTQVFVNNEDALYAVKEGYLVVKQIGSGNFQAFTTEKWQEELKSRKLALSEIKPKHKNASQVGVVEMAEKNHSKNRKESVDEDKLKIILREYGLEDLYNLRRQNGNYVLTIFRKNQTVRDTIVGPIFRIAEELEKKYGDDK